MTPKVLNSLLGPHLFVQRQLFSIPPALNLSPGSSIAVMGSAPSQPQGVEDEKVVTRQMSRLNVTSKNGYVYVEHETRT